MVLLVFWHIYSPCTRRVFLKPRSVYPWGFTYTFLKVWKPSGITGKYYLSIYTNGMLILLKMDAWSGSYGWFPYNGGLLPEFSFHIQRASLKGQHLTFDVCWQAHLTSIWLRLKGWELPGDDKGRAIRFRPRYLSDFISCSFPLGPTGLLTLDMFPLGPFCWLFPLPRFFP